MCQNFFVNTVIVLDRAQSRNEVAKWASQTIVEIAGVLRNERKDEEIGKRNAVKN